MSQKAYSHRNFFLLQKRKPLKNKYFTHRLNIP